MKYAMGCLALVGGFVCFSGAKADDTKFEDKDFVMKAASGGMHEVELGKLASKQATNEKVKAFGERMVKDHTKANEKLKSVAGEIGVKVDGKPMSEHQKHLDHFRDLKGADFDRQYVKHMVKDHEEDVALFKRASTEAKSKALASFAKETLPTLEEHLKMIKQIESSMGSTKDR